MPSNLPAAQSKQFFLTIVLSVSQQTGGGFFQSISSLRALLSNSPDSFVITVLDARGTLREEAARLKREHGLKDFEYRTLPKRLPKLRDRILTDNHPFYRVCRFALRLIGREVKVSRLARFVDSSSADLVYFVSPVPEAHELQKKAYVWTLWDLFHLDHPEFPELRTSGKFEVRESFNSKSIRKASAVVVDSYQLAIKAHEAFGAPLDKFVVVPYAVPNSRKLNAESIQDDLPSSIKPFRGKFFFYPAQLWAHKNHARVIEALSVLVDKGYDIHAVFVGRDHGAGSSLQRIIDKHGVQDRVHVLGYVEDAEIAVLYRESLGLLMSSYVGPNIPPLEAMSFRVPIIATNIHRNQLGDAALFFDPDNWEELANRMQQIMDPSTREQLVSAGDKRLVEIRRDRDSGNALLRDRLLRISRRVSQA